MRVTAHISSIDWDADEEAIENLPRNTTVEFDADFSSDMEALVEQTVDVLSENHGWTALSLNIYRIEIELD